MADVASPAAAAAAADGAADDSEKSVKESSNAMKECPFCFSEIRSTALRCRFCSSDLRVETEKTETGFTTVREDKRHDGLNCVVSSLFVKITDQKLTQQLRNYIQDNPIMLDKTPVIPAVELFTYLPSFRAEIGYYDPVHPFRVLVEFLEKEFEEDTEKYKLMIESGKITFDGLQYAFTRGQRVWSTVHGCRIGMEISEASYIRGAMGRFFICKGEVVKSTGEKFFLAKHSFVVAQFAGLKNLSEISIKPLTPDIEKELVDRGKLFAALGIGTHYRTFRGAIQLDTQMVRMMWKCDGRVMFDTAGFMRQNPGYEDFTPPSGRRYGGRSGENDKELFDVVPEDRLYQSYPFLAGFAFSIKKWGELQVDLQSEIKFDSQAFDRLVLPPENKALIHALVTHRDQSFQDVISGKGGGCIFLLHGPPGVGKTLTAEAIAELLHKPLYAITVGELGTDTNTLEVRLQEILDVASIWDAVILIDEADIFLERRSERDIQRNAMTGIFLRLLEYHQGVLFLTTNRVRDFDEAFYSRISVGLKYTDLDESARLKVWKTFFEVGGICHLDPTPFAKHDLNGRQIRCIVRLSLALAAKEKVPLAIQHIERTIAVTTQFKDDLKASRSNFFTSSMQ